MWFDIDVSMRNTVLNSRFYDALIGNMTPCSQRHGSPEIHTCIFVSGRAARNTITILHNLFGK